MPTQEHCAETERERCLVDALAAILRETGDYPEVKPISSDSYLPPNLIDAAKQALKPYGLASMNPPAVIERSAVQAMHNRAKQLVLTQAWLGKAEGLRFAQGALSALHSIIEGLGAPFAAQRDASMGGYRALAGFEAAWAALPVGAKNFTLVEAQEFLSAHGVEVATDALANSKVDTVSNLEDGMVPAINGNDEHDSTRADVGDGSGLHDSPFLDHAIVAQGGAA